MLNPNEAPSEMIAVEATGENNVCGLCHYRNTMCPDVHCMRHSRKDGHDVYFKFHEPQPDLLNAATHERRARTVTISAELSDAQVTLFRKAEQPKLDAAMSMLDKLAFGKWEEMHENARYAVMGQVLDAAYPGLRDAVEQVLRAGGGK